MLTSRTHYRYISGWCSSSMHKRCKGSYAGTACACSCHADPQAGGATAPAR